MQTRHALLNQEDIRRPSGARAAEERDGFAQHAASGFASRRAEVTDIK